MNRYTTYTIANILAIVCGIWFVLGGWAWVYLFNVIFVFPFALVGFGLWLYGRHATSQGLNKVAGWLLVIGFVISMGFLMGWYLLEGA